MRASAAERMFPMSPVSNWTALVLVYSGGVEWLAADHVTMLRMIVIGHVVVPEANSLILSMMVALAETMLIGQLVFEVVQWQRL